MPFKDKSINLSEEFITTKTSMANDDVHQVGYTLR